MHNQFIHRTINTGLIVGLGLLAFAGLARAQQYTRTTPTPVDVYCSGVVSDKAIPDDSYLISGENSRYRSTFAPGDNVFINRGAENGVKIGDQFDVVRAVKDATDISWFKDQPMLSRAMGTVYADIGRLQVVHVDPKTSTAVLAVSCGLMQRGDIVRPFEARPVPQFHETKTDPFATPSGKKTAMIVSTKDFGTIVGSGRIVYVNLGSGQGVQVGDYFRVFRYQGTHTDTLYQIKDMAYKAYGYGSTPVAYEWDNLPRHVLGEGIVLRTGPNSSTVLLTDSRQEIFVGDYVEVE
jgi:hypothetical protein